MLGAAIVHVNSVNDVMWLMGRAALVSGFATHLKAVLAHELQA